MNGDYFHRVQRETPTRFWINNPTLDDAERALRAGAVACTTNPTYAARELAAEPEAAGRLLEEAVRTAAHDGRAVDLVQRGLCSRILARFLPFWKESGGTAGFVSIQGDPTEEDDPARIVRDARECRDLGPNFIAKIPVTAPGLDAIAALAAEGVPVIATEVMAVSQALEACRRWEKAVAGMGRKPAFYVTHITGILEDHLAETAGKEGLGIPRERIAEAALLLARRQLRLLKERGFAGRMLGGGARGLHHFTEMVGLDMDVTINWKGTADALIGRDDAVASRADAAEPQGLAEELCVKFPDFRRAYLENGLAVDEFKDYGPVVRFRRQFLDGWETVRKAVRDRRSSV